MGERELAGRVGDPRPCAGICIASGSPQPGRLCLRKADRMAADGVEVMEVACVHREVQPLPRPDAGFAETVVGPGAHQFTCPYRAAAENPR